MKRLNLINLEKSDIKYKISKFPDGQQNVTIFTKAVLSNHMFHYDLNLKESDVNIHWNKNPVRIISHLNNFLDLELILCTVSALKEIGVTEIHLFTPYFIGARSDRKFEEGGNWYLKQVVCPIINSLHLNSITIVDPHSYVLGNLLNNFKFQTNLELVKWATLDICGPIEESGRNSKYPITLISPDAGASHKIYKIAEQIGYTGDIVTCSKERDEKGNLTKTVVPVIDDGNCNKDFIIIDDICDGGRTFINIAQKIKEYFNHEDFDGYQPKIYLIITHGIFSAGFTELNKWFDKIYCTNSYSDIGDFAGNDLEKTNVKQLKII